MDLPGRVLRMSDLRQEAMENIIRSFREITHTIDHFSDELKKKHKITGPQAGTLRIIVQNGPVSLTDVCDRTYWHITTVGGIVDRLERDGYVVKNRDPHDRRKVILAATPKGKRLASSVLYAMPLSGIKVLERLSTKEIVKIKESMQVLSRMLREEIRNSSKKEMTRKNTGMKKKRTQK